MSNEERNEYMKNVKWTTAIYFAISLGTVLFSINRVYYGLTATIEQSRNESKTQIQGVYYRLNSKIDSLKGFYDLKLERIEDQIENIPSTRVYKKHKQEFMTERWVNGKLVMIPYK